MLAQDIAHDGEPKARLAGFAISASRQLREGLKSPLEQIRRQARAIIVDAQDDFAHLARG